MSNYTPINSSSEKPKYKQVEELILNDIISGILKKGQRIPSINETSEELLLSRDTVEKGYLCLKKKGIIASVKGKGFYIQTTNTGKKLKICLIFNKLSNYKRNLYYSFIKTLGANANIDVFIYNYDTVEFENIIDNNLNNYDYFVILPHFKTENSHVEIVIQKIPKKKVLIIDRYIKELKDYPLVYQEYDKDIQDALSQALPFLEKYKRINLIFPKKEYYSSYIKKGFTTFCNTFNFNYRILDTPDTKNIDMHESYVIISDTDLYCFIKIIKKKKWIPGKDIGIISYNESPVKEILCDGISTISTNHDQIGKMAAEMILKKDFKRIKCPFRFIKRKSL